MSLRQQPPMSPYPSYRQPTIPSSSTGTPAPPYQTPSCPDPAMHHPNPTHPHPHHATGGSVYSQPDTYVNSNQSNHDAKVNAWQDEPSRQKEQPAWAREHHEQYASPPRPQPAFERAGPSAYGQPSAGFVPGGGGFDPKYDSINYAPPSRDKKRGVYGTMCCGSPWGVFAWTIGVIGLGALIAIVLWKVLVSLNCNEEEQ